MRLEVTKTIPKLVEKRKKKKKLRKCNRRLTKVEWIGASCEPEMTNFQQHCLLHSHGH